MLKLNHITGFGSGVAAAAGGDVTSYVFDGTGDYLQIPDHADWDFPQSNFTVEFWIYLSDGSAPAAEMFIWAQHVDTSNEHNIRINGTSGSIRYFVKESPSVSITSNTAVLGNSTWNHVAVVRSGNDYYIWIDGVDQVASGSPDADTPGTLAGDVYIGQRGNGSTYLNGYIDEIRISDIARYTTGFTPSSTQFTSDANTLLLIHGGEAKSGTTGSGATFTDSGDTGHTVTENGNAIESTGNFYKF
jgi:hypothetical protein